MDTGAPAALQMNSESIAMKVLTSGYHASTDRERRGGDRRPHSGTNRFRGRSTDVERNSDWYANSKTTSSRDPKPILR